MTWSGAEDSASKTSFFETSENDSSNPIFEGQIYADLNLKGKNLLDFAVDLKPHAQPNHKCTQKISLKDRVASYFSGGPIHNGVDAIGRWMFKAYDFICSPEGIAVGAGMLAVVVLKNLQRTHAEVGEPVETQAPRDQNPVNDRVQAQNTGPVEDTVRAQAPVQVQVRAPVRIGAPTINDEIAELKQRIAGTTIKKDRRLLQERMEALQRRRTEERAQRRF